MGIGLERPGNSVAEQLPAAQSKRFWPLELVIGLLPLSLVIQFLVWWIYLPLGLHAIADFRQMYTGGYMIRTGHAFELYDFDAQMRFQRMLFPEAAKISVLLISHVQGSQRRRTFGFGSRAQGHFEK